MYRRRAFSIGLLAAASLLFESSLTRLLAVAQYYHFAFLVISLALLGYGASGTFMSLVSTFPRLNSIPTEIKILLAGFGFAISVGIAYGTINIVPFDSYSIAWDRKQIFYLGLYYLVLALPFFMTGFASGTAISASKGKSHLIYGANLAGSGLGAIITPMVLEISGVLGVVLLSAVIGMLGVFPMVFGNLGDSKRGKVLKRSIIGLPLFGLAIFGYVVFLNSGSHNPMGLILSPYKGLSQVSRFPDSKVIFSKWNAISRVDVIQNASIHRLPGLSYQYRGMVPTQIGISVDGESPQPITLITPEDFDVGEFLPESLAFLLKPKANVLVIEPGGGLGVLQALWGKASEISVIKENQLEVKAVRTTATSMNVFDHPAVHVISNSFRAYLRKENNEFNLVFFPLVDPYFPVASGAYSLAEEYSYTVEAFMDVIQRLSPGGVIVVSRWLQMPPSESIRMGAIWLSAMDALGIKNPSDGLVMYRGIQTMTIMVKPEGWTPGELNKVRVFCEKLNYDLVWAPDIQEEEINRFNKLQEPYYYQAIKEIVSSEDFSKIQSVSKYDIAPPTDDHPFFYHFFKWEQTPEVIASLGHIWQPFGGSGFLVLFALLAITSLITAVLILVPMLIGRSSLRPESAAPFHGNRWKILAFFSLLGLAFLFVEIPLVQLTILLLGQPIYAFTLIVFVILSFSGLGSILARRVSSRPIVVMAGLSVLSLLMPIVYPKIVGAALGWDTIFRIIAVILGLAPMAILMGMPFPLGLISLEETDAPVIPWVWAVNGSISVIASILSAILILSYGFRFTQLIGGFLYVGATIIFSLGFGKGH